MRRPIAGKDGAGYAEAHRQARPHPDRARQFMPFAALKGYRELVRQQERIVANGEPNRSCTPRNDDDSLY